VHVTCHGGLKDDKREAYWTLDHTNPITFDYRIYQSFVRTLGLVSRPLVFGNACASAGTQTDLAALQGFGAAFLSGGGALNFVGTFAPITRTTAVVFAERFYAQLFSGLPVGEALRRTKAGFAAQDLKDPSYLFYCLYGPPDSTYVAVPHDSGDDDPARP
jgi:hypothetical protein